MFVRQKTADCIYIWCNRLLVNHNATFVSHKVSTATANVGRVNIIMVDADCWVNIAATAVVRIKPKQTLA